MRKRAASTRARKKRRRDSEWWVGGSLVNGGLLAVREGMAVWRVGSRRRHRVESNPARSGRRVCPRTSSTTARPHSTGFFEHVEAADVGVIQRRDDLGFTLEPGQSIGILREQIGQNFEGDSRLSLVSPVQYTLPMPSAPIRATTLNAPSRAPGCERHRLTEGGGEITRRSSG